MSMPVFVYLLLISKLCYCETLTSIELFDLYDPLGSDFELPTDNITGKVAEAVPSRPLKLTTVQAQSETAKLNSSTTPRNPIIDIPNRFNTNSIENLTLAPDVSDNNIGETWAVDNTLEQPHDKTSHNKELWSNNSSLNKTDMNNTVTMNWTRNYNIKNQYQPPALSLPNNCPEEQPHNIGPYEVPTQRDTILHLRSHLLAMYSGFRMKAMNFLKDIKEATKASWSSKMFCQGPAELMHYRRCVRWVGDLAVLTTKSLVTALETMRQSVATLMQGKICNISSLNIDPIHLIRILAAERVSLEFALPDFLRQLHACTSLCPSTRGLQAAEYLKTARLTNKDFVLRHYYTQQNFNEQLNHKYKI